MLNAGFSIGTKAGWAVVGSIFAAAGNLQKSGSQYHHCHWDCAPAPAADAQFTPINIDPNANGTYYSMQLRGGQDKLDIFGVLGLPADGPELDISTLRSFFRTQLIKHVVIKIDPSGARSQGPEIPD